MMSPLNPSKPILLDTQLLVLYVVGKTNRSMVSRHKRLQAYDDRDYLWIERTVKESRGLVLCPNVLTETSNLLRQTDLLNSVLLAQTFRDITEAHREHYLPSTQALGDPLAPTFGLTDAVLLALLASGSQLLTSDLNLWLAASARKLDAHNYAYIRESWL